MRTFDTGATRDTDATKFDYEGFLHPLVLKRFAQYMHKHRVQADGQLRDSDNWQKGIPKDAYMKSGMRHVMDWWSAHRSLPTDENIEEILCAVMFNAMGYLFEELRATASSAPAMLGDYYLSGEGIDPSTIRKDTTTTPGSCTNWLCPAHGKVRKCIS